MGSSRDFLLLSLVIMFLTINTKCCSGARYLTQTISKENQYPQLKENRSLGNAENTLDKLHVQKTPDNDSKFQEDCGDVSTEEPNNECQETPNTKWTPKDSYNKPAVPKYSNDPECSENPDEKPVITEDPDNIHVVPECSNNTPSETSNDEPPCSDTTKVPVEPQCSNTVPVVPETPDEPACQETSIKPTVP